MNTSRIIDAKAPVVRQDGDAITVWKDGTWQLHREGDAYYNAADPDFLVNIPYAEIQRLHNALPKDGRWGEQ